MISESALKWADEATKLAENRRTRRGLLLWLTLGLVILAATVITVALGAVPPDNDSAHQAVALGVIGGLGISLGATMSLVRSLLSELYGLRYKLAAQEQGEEQAMEFVQSAVAELPSVRKTLKQHARTHPLPEDWARELLPDDSQQVRVN